MRTARRKTPLKGRDSCRTGASPFRYTLPQRKSPVPALRHAILLEPRLQALPAILGGSLAVTGAIVRVEGVRRVRIDDDLGGLARTLESLAHLLDRLDRDA